MNLPIDQLMTRFNIFSPVFNLWTKFNGVTRRSNKTSLVELWHTTFYFLVFYEMKFDYFKKFITLDTLRKEGQSNREINL